MEALIAEDSRVRYLRWRDGNELNRYLNACDIYVQPGKVSAIAQNAICRNSVVILNNLKEYRPFVNGMAGLSIIWRGQQRFDGHIFGKSKY